jgi:hypothetical protein
MSNTPIATPVPASVMLALQVLAPVPTELRALHKKLALAKEIVDRKKLRRCPEPGEFTGNDRFWREFADLFDGIMEAYTAANTAANSAVNVFAPIEHKLKAGNAEDAHEAALNAKATLTQLYHAIGLKTSRDHTADKTNFIRTIAQQSDRFQIGLLALEEAADATDKCLRDLNLATK